MKQTIRWCALASLTVVVSAPLVAGANEPDPAGATRGDFFSLSRLDGYLELTADYGYTRVASTLPKTNRLVQRGRSQVNEQWSFEERLGLGFAGSIIDPRIITFGGEFSFGLAQDRFQERVPGRRMTDNDRGYLLEYDLKLDFFQGSLVSGSVYGRRLDTRINRRFQPSLREDRTEFGTSWYFAHERLPMELRYDYRETDRTNNTRSTDNEHYTDSSLFYSADWIISDHHRFKLSYEHAETKQEYQGADRPFATTRDLFILNHEIEFGSESQHSFRTLVHWQEETGDFARDFVEIGPQLMLRHSDSLQTFYRYQFNRERYEGLDVETQRADFQIVHQMYTNLTTTFDMFGLYEDVEDDINTTQYGLSVDWQYNRKNRWGRLYANLALAYDTQEVDGDEGRRVVLDEAITFRDPVPPQLRNRNIVAGTLVVTDATNRRVLRSGIDYVVVVRSNATLLDRVRGGAIADGDTVLVDYSYNTPQNGSLDTIRVDFNLEQRFDNGLTPYYRFSYRNQEDSLSTGFVRRADRTNHHRIGANYEQKTYTLGAEWESFDDTVEPFDGFHLSGRVGLINKPDHSLGASARLSRLFFSGGIDSRNVTMADFQVDHRWRLSEAVSTIGRVAYRLEDDSIDGTTHNWDVTAGLEYVVGDLTCEWTVEYDRLGLPNSDEDNIGMFFRLRRDFPNVLAKQ
jgi:hypothetical protein